MQSINENLKPVILQPFTAGYFTLDSVIFYILTPIILIWGVTIILLNIIKYKEKLQIE